MEIRIFVTVLDNIPQRLAERLGLNLQFYSENGQAILILHDGPAQDETVVFVFLFLSGRRCALGKVPVGGNYLHRVTAILVVLVVLDNVYEPLFACGVVLVGQVI